MSARLACEHGDLLIVAEGAARLSWTRTGPARWKPIGLWPSRHEQTEIADRVDAGLPMLVVLAEMPTIVPMLTEELLDAPEDLLSLAEFTGYLAELRIPFLGWLPPELRERGRRFFEATRRRPQAKPSVTRPPLLLDDPDHDAPHVRFARWLRPGHPPVEDLVPVATKIFLREDQP
ncbi:hypothetical protein [Amycolatopsis sp. CA-230715]|uniref:hypothetical protein n=1 Tax=Amycolatopsis sp. CA-230715 TaxID=2745196 RepID=UPI001C032208|nr:hypothetical protein [Amycolatopsis sp. CA-230715]QWF85862.1 hypothetical protein HUW46_09342 [Amycolatopsis sp. CA-230715]